MVPTPSTSTASGSPAQGPAVTKLEQKVQSQDKQIAAMQQKLETVTHTQTQMLGEQKQIRGDFRDMAAKTQEELDKVSKGFEATMMKLNAKQDAQMTRGFDELRQLIQHAKNRQPGQATETRQGSWAGGHEARWPGRVNPFFREYAERANKNWCKTGRVIQLIRSLGADAFPPQRCSCTNSGEA